MTQAREQTVLMAVSAPPFWHCGRTIKKRSMHTLLALAPAALLAVWHWGMPAARVMALAMVTGIAVEALCQKMMGRDIAVDDFTAAVSSLLLAFMLPAAAPWWLVMVGAALAILFGKMAFGGYGANPVNTAVVGWAMLAVSWPELMDARLVQLQSQFIDPLVHLKFFGAAAADQLPLLDMMLGEQMGGLGASQTLALFVGGLYLMAQGAVRWEVPLAYLLSLFVTASLFNVSNPDMYATPMFHLCSGAAMLGAFFLATESASSPEGQIPMLLYGALAGALVLIIRTFGIYPDGVPFAILCANLVAPLLDMIRPKPFGAK